MAAAYKEHGPMRRTMERDARGCWWCGTTEGLACHEMLNGPNRMRAFGRRECLLVLCSHCNCNVFTDKKRFPLARQLAIKMLKDANHFDLDVIREVAAPEGCPNPPVLVTADDVLYWLKYELA